LAERTIRLFCPFIQGIITFVKNIIFMITGLYETHIYVKSIERSINFYQNKLKLKICNYERERGVVFFWIGRPKKSFLGVWEKPEEELSRRHFAFESTKDFIINDSIKFLNKRDIIIRDAFELGDKGPISVFSWIPAVSIFFLDPDDNSLEFISVLDGKPKPELGIVSYEEWLLENKKK